MMSADSQSFQQKPVWKQFALRNSMKRVVTTPRRAVNQSQVDKEADSDPQKDLPAFTFIMLVLVVGLSIGAVWDSTKRYKNRLESAENSGHRAYDLGVPAEANPYVGESVEFSKIWLKGWIAAKESELANDK